MRLSVGESLDLLVRRTGTEVMDEEKSMVDWQSPGTLCQHALNTVVTEIWENPLATLPRPCPCCATGVASLHLFFCRYNVSGRGGGWIWCSACRTYEHWSGQVPSWWENLAGIELPDLMHSPTVLEAHVMQIDAHWALIQAALSK